MPGLDMDFVGKLAHALAPEIEDAAKPYVTAEGDDLKNFGAIIAKNMAYQIARKGDVGEFLAQAKLLAEITRIRSGEVEWATFERVLGVAFKAAKAAVFAAGIV